MKLVQFSLKALLMQLRAEFGLYFCSFNLQQSAFLNWKRFTLEIQTVSILKYPEFRVGSHGMAGFHLKGFVRAVPFAVLRALLIWVKLLSLSCLALARNRKVLG